MVFNYFPKGTCILCNNTWAPFHLGENILNDNEFNVISDVEAPK